MVSRKTLNVCALVAAAAGTVSAAKADLVMSLGYQTLTGSYTSTSATTGTFTAVASAAGQGSAGASTGNVTREPAGGNASFSPGFVAGADPSNFTLSLAITGVTATGAVGVGNFTATDVLGNTISGAISGIWTFSNQVGLQLAFFDATLTNVNFTSVNGTNFVGNVGNAPLAGIGSALPGSMQITFLQFVPPTIFSVNIGTVSTVVQAQVTPTPGALALLGLGGLAAARRRR